MGQMLLNFVFGTLIGFLLAQWFIARHDAKLLLSAFNNMRQAIDDVAKMAERERQ